MSSPKCGGLTTDLHKNNTIKSPCMSSHTHTSVYCHLVARVRHCSPTLIFFCVCVKAAGRHVGAAADPPAEELPGFDGGSRIISQLRRTSSTVPGPVVPRLCLLPHGRPGAGGQASIHHGYVDLTLHLMTPPVVFLRTKWPEYVCVCVFQVSCTTHWCRSTSAYVETPPVTPSMLVVSRVSGLVCRRRVWGHTVRWGVKTGSKQSQQKTFNGVTVRATPLRLGNKSTLLGPFFFASYCCWKKIWMRITNKNKNKSEMCL